MTDDRLPLAELMAKTGDGDFLRTIAENVLQIIMEADVDGLVGAGRHERSGDRTTWRNGYRDRSLDTRLGTLNLKIPKLRTGAYFPGFLEPRKTVEKALVAVIQEAWIAGVSTRRVDELVQAMGMTGISKSSVSKLCKDIDERVHAFLKRPLAGDWPYLWLDATYLKVREGVGMLESCMDPDLVVEITMQPVRRYGVDAAHVQDVVPLRDITPLPCTPSFGAMKITGISSSMSAIGPCFISAAG